MLNSSDRQQARGRAGWILGAISIGIVIFLRNSRYFPATIVLVLLGMVMVGLAGKLDESFQFGLSLPPITSFRPIGIWEGMIGIGNGHFDIAIGKIISIR